MKCSYCGARTTLPYRCEFCGEYFCLDHRLPESHRCKKVEKRGWKVYADLKTEKEESIKFSSPKPVMIELVRKEVSTIPPPSRFKGAQRRWGIPSFNMWKGLRKLGAILFVMGCGMICTSVYSRFFGLKHLLDASQWWQNITTYLLFGGLLIFATTLALDWVIWTYFRRQRFIIGGAIRRNARMMTQALALVLGMSLFAAFSVLPVNYYGSARTFVTQNFTVPEEKNVQSLTNFLNQVYLREYATDKFDCSEASAFVEWLCEGAGFHAMIATDYARDPNTGLSQLHAWVLVEIRGEIIPIEATTLTIPDPNDNFVSYYDPLSRYESPDDVVKGECLLSEFDWWTVSPYDKMGAFDGWQLIPSAIWGLMEIPENLTGYRIISHFVLFFILIFLWFSCYEILCALSKPLLKAQYGKRSRR